MSFKVGDRVRLLENAYDPTIPGDEFLAPGNEGTIIYVKVDGGRSPLRLDGVSGWPFFEDELGVLLYTQADLDAARDDGYHEGWDDGWVDGDAAGYEKGREDGLHESGR